MIDRFNSKENTFGMVKSAVYVTFGQLDDDTNDYTIDAFVSFTFYTLVLTTIVMNMLIAVMTDRYEIAISEMKFHDAKKKLGRSLRYDLMRRQILGLFQGVIP